MKSVFVTLSQTLRVRLEREWGVGGKCSVVIKDGVAYFGKATSIDRKIDWREGNETWNIFQKHLEAFSLKTLIFAALGGCVKLSPQESEPFIKKGWNR